MRFIYIISVVVFFLGLYEYSYSQDDYQKWLEKEKEQFNKFLAEEDKAFLDFLKKEWKPFSTQQGKKADTEPKPVKMPVAKPKDKPKPPPPAELETIEEITIPVIKPKKKPQPKPIIKKGPQVLNVEFYGTPVGFEKKDNISINLKQPIKSDMIGEAWEKLATSKAADYLPELKNYRNQMKLNDWGYIVLVNHLSRKLYPQSEGKQNLFNWYILIKSGYNAKVAFKDDTIFLLLPNENNIYDNKYVTLDGLKYYFISLEKPVDLSGKVYTYQGKYKNADQYPNMHLRSVPFVINEVQEKTLKFNYQNQKYEIPVKFSMDIVDLFENYPQTDLKVYLTAPVSDEASHSLLKALKLHVQGKSEFEAINFLLRFTQTAFDYKTDDVQFGREKFLMPEETLFYPSSDCEDRSILFSFLVKNLTGLDIIVLDYPGHISTAVKFSSNIGGDAVSFDGKRYVICDPTFINADAGMCMPEYKNVNPEIVNL